MRKKFNIVINALPVFIIFLIYTGCKKAPAYKDVVLITGAETTNIINFAVDTNYSSIALTASATTLVSQDINVNFTIDTSLLKTYNQVNQTNYYIPPAGSYLLTTANATIKAGTNVSSAVPLQIIAASKLVQGRSYLIPVVLKVTKGNLSALPSSATAYVKLNQVITTDAVDLSNGPTPTPVFAKPATFNQFTFEFRVNVAQFAYAGHIGVVSYFQDTLNTNAHTFNLFRFGELSDAINQLQWINSAGKVSSKTLFATNTWYTISCVYDGSTCSMYVNGVLDASFAASGTFSFQQIQIGSGGSEAIGGSIDEMRIWSRALSAGEIQNGLCAVDPTSQGLLAYWKFNEGSGAAITDYSGHGYSFTAPGNFNWITGVKCPN